MSTFASCSSSSVEYRVAPISAVASLVATPVMSGEPSPLSPTVKSTVVALPVPKRSPLQRPAPLTSARVPARTVTD
uniref:Unannotated protein n=1 Tax=freshwater metagenome TaxID=449393 RepID=A0A6J7MU49_9ZZZZ